MLSKKQWMWCAERHQKIRTLMIAALVFAVFSYLMLIIHITIEKGKSPEPFKPMSNFRGAFNCNEKIIQYDMGPFGGNTPSKPGYHEDANALLLENHWSGMINIEALLKHPECIGAILADNANSPNNYALLIYDTQNNKTIYRILRFNHLTPK